MCCQTVSVELLLCCRCVTEEDGIVCLMEKERMWDAHKPKHSAGLRHHIESEIERYVHPIVSFIYCIVYLSLCCLPRALVDDHSYTQQQRFTHTHKQTHTSQKHKGSASNHKNTCCTLLSQQTLPQRPAAPRSHWKDSRSAWASGMSKHTCRFLHVFE